MSDTVGLNENWLNMDFTVSTTWNGYPQISNASDTFTWYTYPYCNCSHSCHCSSRVRLNLKELDTLRRAAKDNKKLSEILQKLTPKIEVEVDFV